MNCIDTIEGYTLWRDSAESSGLAFYGCVGQLALNPMVHRDLEGPLTHRPGTVWVFAFVEDQTTTPIGCASLHTNHLGDKGEVWFDNAWVDPAHRSHGLHGRMFDARMRIAVDLGAIVAKGWARPTARTAFLARGFALTKERGKWHHYERRLDDDKPF